MKKGCYTALVTPFKNDLVDYEGLENLCRFQIENNITGILAVGTTGESPTLAWDEHNSLIEIISKQTKNKCFCIAGTGSNNTNEALSATRHAVEAGVDAVLLVDPYYNGPSSLEIRKEYVTPVARTFPEIMVIPYIIPGRTGAQMLPEDIALLNRECPNVSAVKEATGNLENMKRTREVCGPDFTIFSGDDALVVTMMTDPAIAASGVISVASNIVPGPASRLIELVAEGKLDEADALHTALMPLFKLTSVVTMEETPFGEVKCVARNPLAIKTAMQILGMPSGGCRRPLGKMTRKGLSVVVGYLRDVMKTNPELLAPVESFFEVDINARLNDEALFESLIYTETY
ncbi:4-hydroxy-tetrahydrodipicolinate synthase [Desulfoluna sp.]|uniref:4-hydroxy-tetrahydrodipicolinate synthase n=1 Tax=Desulfoluna sp. TaxID=2045199 RepID=UPI002633D1C0|nr:4-hydroxy-tetrahydrodipicolinate synthase [Desulfoluna sp.]